VAGGYLMYGSLALMACVAMRKPYRPAASCHQLTPLCLHLPSSIGAVEESYRNRKFLRIYPSTESLATGWPEAGYFLQ